MLRPSKEKPFIVAAIISPPVIVEAIKSQQYDPSANSALVSKLQRENSQLKQKLENERKTAKVYLKAAKTEAKDMYEAMMHQRLQACKAAYEEEFEILAR